ncbi:hypothetical protein AK812_SmicGene34818 [Symbiodinium microadriaticum]|uniref:Uncharacterized protein n=1 Tax=Symbiodinium microadriaticum TaxID=2951 RepID=A0A1Q9CN16_SYMMI|nr:hypothetical protein AK812_SmicGene34818 [Symbiodinium microadriaticum]
MVIVRGPFKKKAFHNGRKRQQPRRKRLRSPADATAENTAFIDEVRLVGFEDQGLSWRVNIHASAELRFFCRAEHRRQGSLEAPVSAERLRCEVYELQVMEARVKVARELRDVRPMWAANVKAFVSPANNEERAQSIWSELQSAQLLDCSLEAPVSAERLRCEVYELQVMEARVKVARELRDVRPMWAANVKAFVSPANNEERAQSIWSELQSAQLLDCVEGLWTCQVDAGFPRRDARQSAEELEAARLEQVPEVQLSALLDDVEEHITVVAHCAERCHLLDRLAASFREAGGKPV